MRTFIVQFVLMAFLLCFASAAAFDDDRYKFCANKCRGAKNFQYCVQRCLSTPIVSNIVKPAD